MQEQTRIAKVTGYMQVGFAQDFNAQYQAAELQ
jgi:hypothetical protein